MKLLREFRFLFREDKLAAVILAALATVVAARAATADPATPAEVTAAKALLDAGKYAESRAAFAKILAHAPEHPDANYHAGLFACDDGEWEKALDLEGKALASDLNDARYQYGWGAANGIAALKGGLFSKFGYAKKCLAGYQRAAELDPANAKYHWALLNYYQQAPGFVGGGMELAYGQAAALGKIDPELGRLGFMQLYVAEKKYDLAFRQYDEALRASPDNYFALYNFGRLTLMAGQRLDDGMAAFRRCLELPSPPSKDAPSPASLHWRLGLVWEKKNQPEQARTEFLAALKEQPDFRPAQQALDKLGGGKT